MGFNLETIYASNLNEFCKKNALPINPTYNALKILELSGYVELTEELDNPSKLLFPISKEELDKFLKRKKYDNLIQVLLRSYTGIFSDYVHIDEDVIAERLNTTRNDVYEKLSDLQKQGIVRYIPFKKTPFIIYSQERQDQADLRLPVAAYDERKQRYENQVMAMLDYAKSDNVCRSRMLLAYFGERDSHDCGQCDVCSAAKKHTFPGHLREELKTKIVKELHTAPLSVNELVRKISGNEEVVLQVVQSLLDTGFLERDELLRLKIKSGI